MLIGYARVSTDDQNLDLQRDALRAAGCEKIYEDRMSGAKAARPGLTLALEVARAGDLRFQAQLSSKDKTEVVDLLSTYSVARHARTILFSTEQALALKPALEELTRKEAVIISAARAPGASVETIKAAIRGG